MDPTPANDPETEVVPPPAPRPSFAKKLFQRGSQYFFQFFMLFLAVAAGFFADNLREDFGERRQSSEYAGSMVKDLVRDTLNLNYQISLLNKMAKTIGDLTEYVRDKKIDQLKNSELYRLTSFPEPAVPLEPGNA